MDKLCIYRIKDRPELKPAAAAWFHAKWGIPLEAYAKSMDKSIAGINAIPQWYVAAYSDEIIAGLGIIENDFHERKELTPNVCAVYVEKEYRCMGIAGKLLQFVCDDMRGLGIDTLYLLTDHSSFYERYGWEYLCDVMGDGETESSRMYIHKK